VDDASFDHLRRSLTIRPTRRRLLSVLTGITGVCFGEAAAKPGDPKNRVRASRKGEKVAICHRAGDGTYHRIEVAERAVQTHLDKHGDFRFINCCADDECKDGETCDRGECAPVCAPEDTSCAVFCPGPNDDLCASQQCGCATGGDACTCRAERCVAAGETCETNFDCCDGLCVCVDDNCTCDCIAPEECASGGCGCSNGACTCRPEDCNEIGGTCADDSDCCDGPCDCTGAVCTCTCVANGGDCASDEACCSENCGGGKCRIPVSECGQPRDPCQTEADCCFGTCADDGVCIPFGCAGRCRG
jgi:hypothetical protein